MMEFNQRKITKSYIFNENNETLWWRWTSHVGLKTFFGKDNKIELKAGGAFEIYFLLENPEGQRGSETCKIISFIEYKELVFTWNAPPHLEEARNSAHRTIVKIEFDEINPNETQLRLTHSNWPEGEIWDQVFDYFNNAWDIVLINLSNNSKNLSI